MNSFQLGLFSVFPTLIGAILFRRLPVYGRCFWYVIVIAFFMEYSQVVSRLLSLTELPAAIYFFVIVTSTAAFGGYAYSVVHKKPIVFHVALCIVGVAVLEALLTGLSQFNPWSFLLVLVAYMVASICTFIKISSGRIDSYFFWFNGAVFFSAFSILACYLSSLYLNRIGNYSLEQSLLHVHSFIMILINILLGASLWKLSSSSTTPR